MDFNQMIARKMLTATRTPSSSGASRSRDGTRRDREVYLSPPEPRPVPPWESGPAVPIQGDPTVDQTHLPTLRLHQAYQALHPTVDISSYASGEVARSESDETTDADDDADGGAAGASASTAATPKYVTFGTHDRIHQWDEQLDVLKYVDEEFLEVAHFLIDVVGVSNDDLDEYLVSNDEEEKKEVNVQPRGCTAGVLPLLFGCSIGREVESFGSALESAGSSGSLQGGDVFRPGRTGRYRYRLTEKLVHDFVAAMKYRMEIIESSSSKNASNDDGEEEEEKENDVVARTREIARKVNAYGLPLLPPVPRASIDEGEGPMTPLEQASEKEEEDDDDEEFLDTFGKGLNKQFFPVLPINDDDDENEGGSDENNSTLSNRQLHVENDNSSSSRKLRGSKSLDTKDSSKQSTFKIPTPASICNSLLRQTSSSATPGEEDCRRRLSQIRLEIENSQKMIDATSNESVRAACRRRVDGLRVERRIYQIIQERHKIQAMMETTEVPHVRRACKERFKQLIAELGTLRLEQEEEEEEEETTDDNVNASAGNASSQKEGPADASSCGKAEVPACDNKASVRSEGVQVGEPACDMEEPAAEAEVARAVEDLDVAKSICGEDGQWYERVFQYVTGEPPSKEEMSDPLFRCGLPPDDRRPPERDGYDPERWQEQQSSQQHPRGHYRGTEQDQYGRSQVRFMESTRCDGHGPPSEGHIEENGDATCSASSPPSDEAVAVRDDPRYRRGQARDPVTRRPAANAVNPSTSWFEEIFDEMKDDVKYLFSKARLPDM